MFEEEKIQKQPTFRPGKRMVQRLRNGLSSIKIKLIEENLKA